MPASYSEHPTFYLRILLFVSAAVGITLSAIVWSLEPRDGTDLVVPMTLLFISALASMAALTNSFVSTNEHDNDPVLPSRIYLVIDSVIAFLLHGTFWLVSFVSFFLYLLTSRIILAYSALPLLVSSILHFICFWKALITRERAQWRADLPNFPCCVSGVERSTEDPPRSRPARPFGGDGDGGDEECAHNSVNLPADTSNDFDALLCGDHQAEYGTIDPRSGSG